MQPPPGVGGGEQRGAWGMVAGGGVLPLFLWAAVLALVVGGERRGAEGVTVGGGVLPLFLGDRGVGHRCSKDNGV